MNVTRRARFIILGMNSSWSAGIFKGWGIFRFQMGNEEKKLCKLRRQCRQWRPDLTLDMSVRSSRTKRQNSFCNMSPPPPLSPYPHLHKHIQAQTRHPNTVQLPTKVALPPPLTFSNEWAEPYRHPYCSTHTHKHYEMKRRASNMTDRAVGNVLPTQTTEPGCSINCIFTPRSLKLNSVRFAFQGHCSSLSQTLFIATDAGVLPRRANKRKIGEKPDSVYLFAVSAVIAVVWVDSCPWRYGEQHFSRRYVRSGEHSPGCQLTSAAGEVSAWSPAGWLQVVLLQQQDRGPQYWPLGSFRGPSHGSRWSAQKRGLVQIHLAHTVISPTRGGCVRMTRKKKRFLMMLIKSGYGVPCFCLFSFLLAFKKHNQNSKWY